MLIGHPLVAVPATLSAGGMLYVSWLGGSEGIGLGLFAAATLAAVGQANQQASAYKQWRAEWNAMAGVSEPRFRTLKAIVGIAMGFVLVFGGLSASPNNAYAIGYLLGRISPLGLPFLALLALAVLVRWIRLRPKRTSRALPVTVVAKTNLPVPTLSAAYAALPDYCQRLLARPGS